MKTINKIFLLLCFLLSAFTAKAEWKIVGAAVENSDSAILAATSVTTDFVYVGKLTSGYFKITDGDKTYIHSCGDNDPLEQTVTLAEQPNADATGLRIRYTGVNQYFKITLTVGRSTHTLIAERIVPPSHLYIMGGPFNYNATNWLLDGAVELTKDPENPFIFWYRGDIRYNPIGNEGGNIKILMGRSWSKNYHPATAGNVPLAQAVAQSLKMRLGGEDNKWSIPADRSKDGRYVIKINTLDLTIQVMEFEHNIDETPLGIFITGAALPCAWSNEAPVLLTKTSAGIYQWQGEIGTGLFKFLQRKGTWARCYVATSQDERVIVGQEHSIVYEFEYYNGGGHDYKFAMPTAGEYHFTVNLNTMKMLVKEPVPAAVENSKSENGVTFFSNNGKLFLQTTDEDMREATLFSIDGRKIVQKSFVSNAEFALPKGFYVVIIREKNNEKITGHKVFVY